MNLPVLIFSVALGSFVAEWMAPRTPAVRSLDLAIRCSRVAKNVGMAGLNVVFTKGVMFFLAVAAARYSLAWRPGWLSGEWGLVFDFVLLDLWIYAWHRVVHAWSFTWRFHQVHHQDEVVDITTAVRFHPGDVLFSYVSRGAVILLFGVSLYHAFLFEAATVAAAIFHHANVRLPRRFERTLALFIVTPSFHHTHHHPKRGLHDSNYGTILSIWDRLLGSYVEHPQGDFVPGLATRRDEEMLALLARPFRSGRESSSERAGSSALRS